MKSDNMVNIELYGNLSFEIFNSIDSIDKNKWDSGIEKDDFYMKYDFLKITEKSVLNVHSYYYIIIFDKGDKVANVVLFSIKLDLLNLVSNSAKGIISKIRKIWKNSFFINTLFCGLPVSIVDNSIRIFDKKCTRDILYSIDTIIKNIIKNKKIKITFLKDFTDDELEWIKCIENKSYKLISGLPSNDFTIKWNSFDEYVRSLRGKYRSSLRKVLEKRDKLEISVLENNDIVFDDNFYNLYEQVNGSSEFQLEKLSSDFFRKVLSSNSFSAKLITIKRENILLGHISIVELRDKFVPLFIGYEKIVNNKYDIYFNLVYKILEVAMHEKKKIVKCGQTADFFKRKIGCTPVNVWWFIYVTSPIIRPFTRKIFSKLFPPIPDYKFEIFEK
ncbi:hypothetical protein [Bacteroides sp.]|jgi:hypothetical protein|uniref:hypothetical protein n=1 Tax=Bacteroides sp. TaxID=29523 RepID=UPI00260AA0EA|nr:hypothetical protein [Bacteroides sp.]MDD3038028.1 hypothetical protein [Bacteroides sp.]